jgi:hypothetical protein
MRSRKGASSQQQQEEERLVASITGEGENPLLSPDEQEEKKSQELGSVFLVGLLTGGLVVGGFFFVRWMLTKTPSSKMTEVLEATY